MSRLLLFLTLALSAALTATVLLAPWIVPAPNRVVALFAHDVTLRRTALASALGLVVTGCVFFRNKEPRTSRNNKPRMNEPRT
jgi:hypothetical protein